MAMTQHVIAVAVFQGVINRDVGLRVAFLVHLIAKQAGDTI